MRFSFCIGNSVGSVSGLGSGVLIPTGIKSISDGEMVKCVFFSTGIESMGDFVPLVLFVPIEVESKVGQLIEIFPAQNIEFLS